MSTEHTTATPIIDAATANTHMRKLIDEALSTAAAAGPYTTRSVAASLTQVLRESDPELLRAWLDAHATDLVYGAMTYIERSERSHVRAVSGRSAFAKAVQRHADGDAAPVLAQWLSVTFDVAGEKKIFAAMTRDDCLTAAKAYEDRAHRSQMQQVMLETVAKRLRAGETVGQKWTDAQLGDIWRQLGAGR